MAAEKPYRTSLTKDEINALPIAAYTGRIAVVETPEQLDEAIRLLNGDMVIGLDTEMRPCFEKGRLPYPTALLQLCGSQAAVLVRVQKVPVEGRLAELLANPNIIKVGVGIGEDLRLLRRDAEFVARGLVDLSTAAQGAGITTLGLRSLAANLLSVRISKGAQCSNWERSELQAQQIIYAATDAWIGREIYLKMCTMPEFVFSAKTVTDATLPSKARQNAHGRRRVGKGRGAQNVSRRLEYAREQQASSGSGITGSALP